jgi:hypothetical protein
MEAESSHGRSYDSSWACHCVPRSPPWIFCLMCLFHSLMRGESRQDRRCLAVIRVVPVTCFTSWEVVTPLRIRSYARGEGALLGVAGGDGFDEGAGHRSERNLSSVLTRLILVACLLGRFSPSLYRFIIPRTFFSQNFLHHVGIQEDNAHCYVLGDTIAHAAARACTHFGLHLEVAVFDTRAG